jgi:mono/diheme cytochrome c family protein
MTRAAKVGIGAVLVVGALAVALGAWLIAARGFSAREEPGAIEAFVAPRLRRLGIPRKAVEAVNPVAATPEVLADAMAHFADHCAFCHGNDGSGETDIGKGLYPKPPDMRLEATQDLSDGELFYIIHNGIRFTGMPAFGEPGAESEDEDSWKLVHFIRRLPKLTPEGLEEMEQMTPKSPDEFRREEEVRRFLRGEDVEPSNEGSTSSGHTH